MCKMKRRAEDGISKKKIFKGQAERVVIERNPGSAGEAEGKSEQKGIWETKKNKTKYGIY